MKAKKTKDSKEKKCSAIIAETKKATYELIPC